MNDEVSVFTDESKFLSTATLFTSLIILIRCFVIASLLPTAAMPRIGLNLQQETTMLSISQLSVTYADGTQALRNINLQLPSGMVGLLGPNGAGKSTLMRALACLQPPDTGQIAFAGIDVLQQPQALRQQLGYLPQHFGVYPHMSCYALLLHMAVLKGIHDRAEQKQQIDSLLQLTNLSAVANKSVATFSGGMRQRFGIAQALLGNPRLLIMDEPTAGLDPAERERLHALLVHISRDKLILLSTHIVEDIENLCPFVALINHGQIVESGAVPDLLTPLQGHVWQTPLRPDDSSTLLSASYRFGVPTYRLFSQQQPCAAAVPVAATLQDRYFFELSDKAAYVAA